MQGLWENEHVLLKTFALQRFIPDMTHDRFVLADSEEERLQKVVAKWRRLFLAFPNAEGNGSHEIQFLKDGIDYSEIGVTIKVQIALGRNPDDMVFKFIGEDWSAAIPFCSKLPGESDQSFVSGDLDKFERDLVMMRFLF